MIIDKPQCLPLVNNFRANNIVINHTNGGIFNTGLPLVSSGVNGCWSRYRHLPYLSRATNTRLGKTDLFLIGNKFLWFGTRSTAQLQASFFQRLSS